jgi:hypothetical protein
VEQGALKLDTTFPLGTSGQPTAAVFWNGRIYLYVLNDTSTEAFQCAATFSPTQVSDPLIAEATSRITLGQTVGSSSLWPAVSPTDALDQDRLMVVFNAQTATKTQNVLYYFTPTDATVHALVPGFTFGPAQQWYTVTDVFPDPLGLVVLGRPEVTWGKTTASLDLWLVPWSDVGSATTPAHFTVVGPSVSDTQNNRLTNFVGTACVTPGSGPSATILVLAVGLYDGDAFTLQVAEFQLSGGGGGATLSQTSATWQPLNGYQSAAQWPWWALDTLHTAPDSRVYGMGPSQDGSSHFWARTSPGQWSDLGPLPAGVSPTSVTYVPGGPVPWTRFSSDPATPDAEQNLAAVPWMADEYVTVPEVPYEILWQVVPDTTVAPGNVRVVLSPPPGAETFTVTLETEHGDAALVAPVASGSVQQDLALNSLPGSSLVVHLNFVGSTADDLVVELPFEVDLVSALDQQRLVIAWVYASGTELPYAADYDLAAGSGLAPGQYQVSFRPPSDANDYLLALYDQNGTQLCSLTSTEGQPAASPVLNALGLPGQAVTARLNYADSGADDLVLDILFPVPAPAALSQQTLEIEMTSTTASQVRWHRTLPGGAFGDALLDGGTLVVATAGALVAFDALTGDETASATMPALPTALASCWGTTAVATGPTGNMSLVDAATATLSPLTSLGEGVFWMTAVAGFLYAVTASGHCVIDPSGDVTQLPPEVLYPEAATSPGLAMFSATATDMAVYATYTTAPLHEPDAVSVAVSLVFGADDEGNVRVTQQWLVRRNRWVVPLVFDGAAVYLADQNSTDVVSVEAATGTVTTLALPGTAGAITGLGAAGGWVAIASADSHISILDVTTGALADEQALPQSASGLLGVYGGLVYAPTPNSLEVYDSATQVLVSFPLVESQWLAAAGTVCHVLSEEQVYALDLSDVFHALTVDTSLLQDYVADPTGVATVVAAPTTHAALTVTDDIGTPRPQVTCRVWSSAPCDVVINGLSQSLNQYEPVLAATDSTGRIRIESAVTSLRSPYYLLWAPFMLNGERIVVYPDHDVLTSLGSVDASGLSTATGYDGQPLLPDHVRNDPGSLNALASTSQGLMSVASSARAPAPTERAAPPAARYLTPITTAGTQYLRDTSRLVATPVSQTSWRLSQGSVSPAGAMGLLDFVELAAADVVAWLDGHPPTKDPAVESWSFADLIDQVAQGTAQFTDFVLCEAGAVAETLLSAVTFVYEGVEQTVYLLIQTAEDAFDALESLWTTIVGDIGRVLEWLSYVFDWSAIKVAHDQMVQSVTGTLQQLASGTYLQDAQTYIAAQVGIGQAAVEQAFNTARSLIGASAFNSSQYATAGEPMDSSARGLQSGAKQTWLVNKTLTSSGMGNGNGGHVPGPVPASSFGSAAGTAFPAFNFSANVQQAATELVTNLGTIVSADVEQAVNQFTSGYANADASNLLSTAAGTVLTGIEDLIELVMDVMKTGVNGLIDVFAAAVADPALLGTLTSPLPIPIVSDMYELITGDEMTVLDLIAWLVAIPATILQRALEDDAAATPAPGGTSDFAYFAYISYITWCPIDTVIEMFGEAPVSTAKKDPLDKGLVLLENVFGIGLPAVIQASLLLDVLANKSEHDKDWLAANVALWAITCVPIALDIVSLCVAPPPGQVRALARFNAVLRLALLLTGVEFFMVLAIILDNVPELQTWRFILPQVLPNIFMVIKPLRAVKTPYFNGPIVVGTVDGVLNVGAGIAGIFSEALDTDGSGAQAGAVQATIPPQLGAPASAPALSGDPWTAPSPQGGRWTGASTVRYAASFFTPSIESPLGPWSPAMATSAGSYPTVSLPIDSSGTATGRRLYRQFSGAPIELVAEVPDNRTTEVVDDEP